MLLIDTILGEHYHSFSPLEITQFDHFIKRNGSEISIKIHTCLVKIKKNNSLHNLGYEYIKKQVFKNQKIGESTFTTYINRLIQSIKEYLILSEINKDNAYIDILWGELLIQRKLRRSQLIRQNNYKIDLNNDPDALLKEYYHKKEQNINFATINNSSSSNIKLIDLLDEQLVALKDYALSEEIEWCISYVSTTSLFNKQTIANKTIKGLDEILARGIVSQKNPIKINALFLGLLVEESMEYFTPLFDTFTSDFEIIPKESTYYIFYKLIKFISAKISDPVELEVYRTKIYEVGIEKNILFNYPVFSVNLFWRDVLYFIRSGRLREIEEIYLSKKQLIPSAERETFNNMFYARLAFERKDYQKSVQLLNMKSPFNSISYVCIYKILLIMCYIMLEDIARLKAEQENYFKYLVKQENADEVAIISNKLFIKYSKYLTISKYKSLKDYMKTRIETAFLPSSPSFMEKDWCRARWQYLKENAES